jgi:hypothetical protein
MRNYPRWSGLKHFNTVASIHFTDAQQFLDILKVSFDSLAAPDTFVAHTIESAFCRAYATCLGVTARWYTA